MGCLWLTATWRAQVVPRAALCASAVSPSFPADASCGSADSGFSGEPLEFRRFHCRGFGFAQSWHQTCCPASLSRTVLCLRAFGGSPAAALLVSLHTLCLQNSAPWSCCDQLVGCGLDKARPLPSLRVCFISAWWEFLSGSEQYPGGNPGSVNYLLVTFCSAWEHSDKSVQACLGAAATWSASSKEAWLLFPLAPRGC